MMGYRLKDRGLQRKLEAIDTNFSKKLTSGIEWAKRFDLIGASINFGPYKDGRNQFRADFRVNEVEIDTAYDPNTYDPNGWNSYPDVTPPENVLMRVDVGDAGKFCGYYRVFSDGPCWVHQNGTIFPEATSKAVKRFRPWE